MKKSITLVIVILVVVIGIILITKGKDAPHQELENKVGATIFPIYDITKQVAGDDFEVVLLLPAGASPHTFDPQPSLLKDLSGAQVVFAIGHGLDDWSKTLSQSVGIPVYTLDHDIELRETGEGHDDNEEGHYSHNHGPIDPHYWLSVNNAKQIARNVAGELARLDGENADVYMSRAEEYVKELNELELELKDKTVGLLNNNIISLHGAWYYFSDEFGFNLVGTFGPSAAKEPTPQYMANLKKKVKEHAVSTIFLEPQLSTDSIKAFVVDHDLGIAVIDPLGGVDGRNSYTELMRYNVEQVVNALNN